jgi:phosphoglycerol transferase
LYQGVLERKGVLSLLREDPWGVARLAAAHLGTMAIPYALPIGIVAVAASSRSANAAPDNVKRLQVLVAMLLIVAFMMTVGFTVKVAPTDLGGLERLHARYYFYVLPLLLIASVAMRDAWPVDRRLLAAGFAALVLALNFWVLRVSRVPASPWFGSIVDHMDVQWYRHMNWLYWPILAGYLILIWRYAKGVLTRRAVVTGLGCYLLIANAGTAEQARFGRPIDSQECGHLAAFFLRMSPGSYAVVADSRSAKVAVVFWIPSLPARASVVRPGDAPVDVAAALKDVDYVIVNGLPPIVHDGGTPRWSAGTCRLFAAR